MLTIAITGVEKVEDTLSPQAALVDFYSAFNGRNFSLMETNWLQTEETSMSNPLGGVKRGWQEIREVYKKIFSAEARVYVEFYEYTLHTTDNMFLAVGRERGFLQTRDSKIDLAIRTSRVYGRYDNRWQQLHHHGSMDNPQLLAAYQTTLLK